MAATFLRKYGIPVSGTTVISVPLIKAGVTNFAIGSDFTPTAGDIVISRDGGSWENISNLPIARTTGGNGSSAVWDFILTGTETQSAQTRVMISDAATKAVEDDYFIVEFFGNVSGMHSIDYGTITQDSNGFLYSDVASVSGTRIQSPNTPGVPIVDTKYILGTQSSGLGGFVGIDWSKVTQQSTTVNLNNTAISGINTNIGGNINGNVLGYVNVSGVQQVVASGLANIILSQSVKCVENFAPSGSLCEIVLQSTNSSVSSNTLHVLRSDGTDFSTKTLVKTVGDAPIRGIS